MKWCIQIPQRIDSEDISQLVKAIPELSEGHFIHLEYGDYIFNSSPNLYLEINMEVVTKLAKDWWEVTFASDTCEIKR